MWCFGVTIVTIGKATILSLFVVGLHVAVNNVKMFGFEMKLQQWFRFALLSN
jgi:hypothetical protein